MKKANKDLIVSLFEWIGFSFGKVRWQTYMVVLLLDFLHKTMAKMMGKTMTEIDLMIERFDYICIDLIIYIDYI